MIVSCAYGVMRCSKGVDNVTAASLQVREQVTKTSALIFLHLHMCRLTAAMVLIIGGDGLAAEVCVMTAHHGDPYQYWISNCLKMQTCTQQCVNSELCTLSLALQIAKNLVLAGVGHVSLADDTSVSQAAFGNFLVPADAADPTT